MARKAELTAEVGCYSVEYDGKRREKRMRRLKSVE
jgi:hypothetical protein